MGLHTAYGLSRIINARGPYTPLGVSRSGDGVAAAVAGALSEFFVMDELQGAADRALARFSGAEAGTVVHCTASAITLAVAAAMTGESPERIAALPDTTGMPGTVVLPAGHAVNYGHPLVQAVRLAGAVPVTVGTDAGFTREDLERGLARPGVACLLLVSSRLVRGTGTDLAEAVAVAHRRGVPVVVDGAAQDFRIGELLGTGADLVAVSGQKYLGSPTAGLVVGRTGLVAAVRAQERGIGRGMKASKEAVIGVLAALEARQERDMAGWRQRQADKVADFVERTGALRGVTASSVPDPTGLPFERARLLLDPAAAGMGAVALEEALRAGSPSIWALPGRHGTEELLFELVPLAPEEIDAVIVRLAELLPG
ncbi:aminotransferase class V-fold PLP-dependent enzyme [Streptomyces catenulae]|uniref:Aminotransferase class V-fold PLP-dependent enzyme n=1 Tax=Streptomyces catenulae TaxID=66875 RepID=A0ABV2Z211_9ACTN|nr:aminotransferase class V-fold PLP-dependent enzyme [Streptomyces catenulae]